MDSDAPSRRSLLGLAGLASLCCVGPGTAAVTGGTSVGLIGGTVQAAVIVGVLGAVGLLFRARSGPSRSRGAKRDARAAPAAERSADLE